MEDFVVVVVRKKRGREGRKRTMYTKEERKRKIYVFYSLCLAHLSSTVQSPVKERRLRRAVRRPSGMPAAIHILREGERKKNATHNWRPMNFGCKKGVGLQPSGRHPMVPPLSLPSLLFPEEVQPGVPCNSCCRTPLSRLSLQHCST